MKHSLRGHTLVEMTTVLAITSILAASTIPLGSHWLQQNRLTEGSGELTLSIGKAVGASMRNQHGLNVGLPVTTVCISNQNQLTVLEATSTTLPNCASGDGATIWSGSLPDRLEISGFSAPVSCLCFNSNAQLTTNSCTGCFTGTTLDLTAGTRTDTLYVH